MPMGRQGSISSPAQLAVNLTVPPLAGTRAGTTNPAGGLSNAIDARGYKSGTLLVLAGVVAVSTGAVTAKVTASATSGGSYTDITGAAVTGFGPDDDNTAQQVDFDIPADRPFLKIVVTQSQATDVGAALIQLRHGAYSRP